MGWFSRKSRRGSEALGNDPPPGVHRSPGLAAFFEDMQRRSSPAILDLGTSVTENVARLSEVSADLTIQDLFRSSGGALGQRAEIFQFETAAELSLPAERAWDAILLWDLVHYVKRSELASLGERLAGIAKPGAVLYLLASSTARIPATPIPFRIAARDRLAYEIDLASSVPAPQFRAREIEAGLGGFEPQRLFQLRNGLMEMLFVRRDDGSYDEGRFGGNKSSLSPVEASDSSVGHREEP